MNHIQALSTARWQIEANNYYCYYYIADLKQSLGNTKSFQKTEIKGAV